MLDISPLLLLFTAIVFLALLIFLNKFLYKPVLAFMEDRDNVIDRDRKHAIKNEGDISSFEEEAKNIILEAKTKAYNERNEIIDKAKEEIFVKVEQKKSELEKKYLDFQEDIKKEKEELKNGLLAQMPLFKEGIKAKLSQL